MASSDNGHGLDGLVEEHTNGVTLTPGEFEIMTDASEKPSKAAGRTGRHVAEPKPRTTRAGAAAATTAPDDDPTKVQAARDAFYALNQIPAPLHPIFNRLPVEEINFVAGHIGFAYKKGFADGKAAGEEASGGAGGIVACGQDHEKYNEVISTLLEAVQLLDSPRPDVAGCMKLADQAHTRLTAT